jgi:hypothetical protein
MTRPERYLTRMIAFLIAVAAVAAVLAPSAARFFMANPALNTLILAVLGFGIVYSLRQVTMLRPEVAWAERYQQGDRLPDTRSAPRLLGPMATMLGDRRGRLSLSATALRTLLDGVTMRLDEQREISRYLIGLLIFLGLLGTFWGLLVTVGSVGETIRTLQVGSGDFAVMFDALKAGLEAPLSGMGTAFSTSLFGLSGSLVLGFLDLQAGQAQNRFANDLEEWLSSATRLSSGGGPIGDGEGGSVPAYVGALLEQTAESLSELQRTMARFTDDRAQSHAALMSLADRLAQLTDQMRTEQDLMLRMAESQAEIRPVLQRMATALDRPAGGLDEAMRGHLRNLDVYMARLLEDQIQGRNQAVSEIRSEIKLLTRTLAAIAETER